MSPNSKIKNWSAPMVWLDLDDTIWDFRGNSLLTLVEVYDHYDLGRFWPDVDAWRHDYHEVNDALWVDYAAERIDAAYLRFQRFYQPFMAAGMPEDEARAIAAEADKYYLYRLGLRSTLVPGARQLLDYLRDSGYRVGVLSNGFVDIQYAKMHSSQIEDYMDFVVLSDAAGASKPNEAIFRYAEQTAGVSPTDCIMIGDNPDTDIYGALRAGWRAIWFNPRGKSVPSCLDAYTGSYIVVDDLKDVIEALRSLENTPNRS